MWLLLSANAFVFTLNTKMEYLLQYVEILHLLHIQHRMYKDKQKILLTKLQT